MFGEDPPSDRPGQQEFAEVSAAVEDGVAIAAGRHDAG
jgi:hypothetical protein